MNNSSSQPTPVADNSMAPAMALALEASFGSVPHWRDAFLAMCTEQDGKPQGAAVAGAPRGYAQLLFMPHQARLINRWTAQPLQATVDSVPLLAVDLGTANCGDWDALLGGIAWSDVYARYQQTIQHHSEPYGVAPGDIAHALLLDVRRQGVYQQAKTRLANARWHNPATVGQWAHSLPQDRKIVVYCVYGHEVSRAAALRLRAAGLNAYYLQGGIDGWQVAGLAVEAMEASQHRG